MGTSGNGDGQPENGGSGEGLPGLPPAWGSVVIPDDPAALAAEAELVQRELRQAPRYGGRPRLLPAAEPGRASARFPLLFLVMAVLVATASLLAAVWSGQPGASPPPTRSTASSAPSRVLPALDLVGEDGATVPLRSLLPAMIIFLDGCDCAEEVLTSAARAAPPGVTVVALVSGRSEPAPIPPRPTTVTGTVRSLADPAVELRGFLQLMPRPGSASAVLADRTGQVVRILPTITSPEDYRADLHRLLQAT